MCDKWHEYHIWHLRHTFAFDTYDTCVTCIISVTGVICLTGVTCVISVICVTCFIRNKPHFHVKTLVLLTRPYIAYLSYTISIYFPNLLELWFFIVLALPNDSRRGVASRSCSVTTECLEAFTLARYWDNSFTLSVLPAPLSPLNSKNEISKTVACS